VQKIIIDTNVLVSALIQRSYPYFILNSCVFDNQVDLCVSDDLFNEYFEVLHRPKFTRFPDFLNNAELVMAQIDTIAKKYYPTQQITEIADIPDNRLLELAVEANADFLITGNTKDFVMDYYKNTKIVSPKDYWENYR
jgi:putative PIN family toxin of toxin-antitoxin system